ncbi:MAG: gamma-glutamyl-gamma-aminobutyrate hydrolase family protein [Thermaerobacter sp.]|nr:gamma-glutamyl-gamma-aminobutyrate hydrolase family protein [Thermaerobacter sp.]
MTQPIVGITTSHVADSVLPNDRLSSSYILAIRDAGGLPVLLPNLGDAAALSLLDALVISGGGDFDPASFGQAPSGAHMAGVSAERDQTELALLRAAPPDLPILGICRGIQALAVAYGGTLIQDVPTLRPSELVHAQEMGRDARTHGVNIEPGSQLAQTLGATAIRVNSFHHQAVDRLPDGFRAVAWADDGLLEGLELPSRPFCLGVQWHPENLTGNEEHARRLFSAVVQAAEVYRRRRRSQEAG